MRVRARCLHAVRTLLVRSSCAVRALFVRCLCERELTRELRGAPVSRLLKAHSAGYRPFTELTLDVVTNLGARAGICSLDGDVRFMLNCMLADIAYFGERQTEAVFVCNELAFLCAR